MIVLRAGQSGVFALFAGKNGECGEGRGKLTKSRAIVADAGTDFVLVLLGFMQECAT